MYRRELPPNHGMLFIFPSEKINSFWMKNTPIPLDMIFISHDRKIVGIVHETVPFSLDGRSVSVPSQYVLEINGGLSRRYGFKAGDAVRFDDVAAESGEGIERRRAAPFYERLDLVEEVISNRAQLLLVRVWIQKPHGCRQATE